jgi:hypothetical protein
MGEDELPVTGCGLRVEKQFVNLSIPHHSSFIISNNHCRGFAQGDDPI